MAKHLITGGSGFLGNLIARRLLEKGEDVRVLDIWKDNTQPKEIEFINADVRDELMLNKAMKGITHVHHNVALVPLTKSGREFWDVNVIGTKKVAELALKNDIKNFVHMSSSAIFGAPTQLPINLSTKPKPIEIYGKAKLEGEIQVQKILNNSDVNLVIIRPRTIIGPGRLGIFQILFNWISENKNIYTIGKGDNLFQFVHAYDLMDAYMLAFDLNHSGIFNIGTEDFGTLRSALENLIYKANSKSKVVALPKKTTITALTIADALRISPLAPWHYKTYDKAFYFDLKEIKALGWKSQFSNDRMLEESYWDFINNTNSSAEIQSPHRKPLSEGLLRIVKKLS